MELVRQAIEARNWLSSTQNPEERQLVFFANMRRWLGIRGAFEEDKARRQDEELAGGLVDANLQDIFLADSLDNVAIDFCNEIAALWASQAMADPEVYGYSSDYYERMWDIDIGGAGIISDKPLQLKIRISQHPPSARLRDTGSKPPCSKSFSASLSCSTVLIPLISSAFAVRNAQTFSSFPKQTEKTSVR